MNGSGRVHRFGLLGANVESATTLLGFLEAGAKPSLVVCVSKQDAGNISDFADLAEIARQHEVPVHQTVDINGADTMAALERSNLDHLYVTGWSQLLTSSTLRRLRRGAIGSHPSNLPSGRGKAALPWTILEGAHDNCITLFLIGEGVDNGSILLRRKYRIAEDANVGELYRVNAENLRDAFLEVHFDLERFLENAQPQDESSASYRGRRIPADGFIDFSRRAQDLVTLVRAVSEPYPGAYAYLGDDKIAFFEAELDQVGNRKGVIGQVLARRSGAILVQAGDHAVWLGSPKRVRAHDSNAAASYEAVNTSEFKIGCTLNYRVHDTLRELRLELMELRKRIDLT